VTHGDWFEHNGVCSVAVSVVMQYNSTAAMQLLYERYCAGLQPANAWHSISVVCSCVQTRSRTSQGLCVLAKRCTYSSSNVEAALALQLRSLVIAAETAVRASSMIATRHT
jgi:hypothetical protein